MFQPAITGCLQQSGTYRQQHVCQGQELGVAILPNLPTLTGDRVWDLHPPLLYGEKLAQIRPDSRVGKKLWQNPTYVYAMD